MKVEIIVGLRMLNEVATLNALGETMMLNSQFLVKRQKQQQPFKILCTLEQFARFMIRRNDMGGSNRFQEMSPTLVEHDKPTMTVIDVSTFYNNYTNGDPCF